MPRLTALQGRPDRLPDGPLPLVELHLASEVARAIVFGCPHSDAIAAQGHGPTRSITTAHPLHGCPQRLPIGARPLVHQHLTRPIGAAWVGYPDRHPIAL